MNRHSFTYPQYCPVVDKNVIIEELTFLSGKKKIRCLYYHKCNCKEMGGCKNKYVKRRIEAVEKKEDWLYNCVTFTKERVNGATHHHAKGVVPLPISLKANRDDKKQ